MANSKEETVRQLRWRLEKASALITKLQEDNKKLRTKLNNRTCNQNTKVINDYFTKCKTTKVDPEFSAKMDEILAQALSVPVEAIRFRSRKKDIVFARQIGCYILHTLYPRRYKTISTSDIGWHFGYSNHTTVLHAVEATEDRLSAVKSVDARIIREVITKIEKILDETPVTA